MARKSSKTAHVLNLLSGHEQKKETAKEAPQASSQEKSNVSIVEKSEKDPVADLIQSKLLDELNKETGAEYKTTDEASETPAASDAAPASGSSSEVSETSEVSEAPAASEPAPASVSSSEASAAPAASDAAPASVSSSEVSETSEAPAASEPAPASGSCADVSENSQNLQPSSAQSEILSEKKEPDFICINIMESIVKDKILYFMRQFDCCTCDRCIADTIALTLNGLSPKYIVTAPAAESALISYYTNKLISDITVEATKACMTIKDNPRH